MNDANGRASIVASGVPVLARALVIVVVSATQLIGLVGCSKEADAEGRIESVIESACVAASVHNSPILLSSVSVAEADGDPSNVRTALAARAAIEDRSGPSRRELHDALSALDAPQIRRLGRRYGTLSAQVRLEILDALGLMPDWVVSEFCKSISAVVTMTIEEQRKFSAVLALGGRDIPLHTVCELVDLGDDVVVTNAIAALARTDDPRGAIRKVGHARGMFLSDVARRNLTVTLRIIGATQMVDRLAASDCSQANREWIERELEYGRCHAAVYGRLSRRRNLNGDSEDGPHELTGASPR